MANAQDAVSRETRVRGRKETPTAAANTQVTNSVQAPVTIGLVALFTVLSSICVVLRFYTR